jgi:hypothetical protein
MIVNRTQFLLILTTALTLGGGSAMAQFGGLFDPPRPPGNVPARPSQPAQPPPPTQLAPQPLSPPGRIQSEDLPPPGAPQRGGNTAVTAAPPAAVTAPAPPAALAPPPEDTPIPPPAQKIANPKAVFAGLDKITGRITAFDAAIGETVQFGALQVTARACYSRPPTETPLTDGFVEVDEITLQGEVRRIFTGWMFAASPGLHAVEHAIYDVWLTDCKGGAPPVADVQPPPPTPASAPAPRPAAPAQRPGPQQRRHRLRPRSARPRLKLRPWSAAPGCS